MSKSLFIIVGSVVAAVTLLVGCQPGSERSAGWTDRELGVLQSLALTALPPLPADPGNAVADNPSAREFGESLFFDPRLSANGGISCATCHQPIRHFTDGLPKGQAIGTSKRNTPSILGTAYSPWLYWDGRRDSLWAQALSPLEDPNEQGGNRIQVLRVIANDESYRQQYESLFEPLPEFNDTERFPIATGAVTEPGWQAAWMAMSEEDRWAVNSAFANVGKAIAAFERGLMLEESRFDRYVAALIADDLTATAALSDDEIRGLRLFIGEANCTQCHNGPLFTNNEFHNTGVISSEGELPDKGRVAGVREVLANPFNCLGEFSDDPEQLCDELRFVRTGPELIGAVRTPSLRNVEFTAPYMHKGQVATLSEVLAHYNEAPDAMIGHNEAKPLALTRRELRQLEAFLKTLGGLAPTVQSESM
ncbi:MAG: cytochrome-c peroxidase [Woeseiaceae bacterium]